MNKPLLFSFLACFPHTVNKSDLILWCTWCECEQQGTVTEAGYLAEKEAPDISVGHISDFW